MTDVVTDPYSGLQLIELSHVWGHGVPSEPGQLDVRMVRAVKHAQHVDALALLRCAGRARALQELAPRRCVRLLLVHGVTLLSQ